jgi:vanillate O-demethylase monooxygenase subunit
MGDPDLADPDLVPDLSFIDAVPPETHVKGLIPTAANYLLVADNIMDLTHADSLHPSTLGGGSISRSSLRSLRQSRRDDSVEHLQRTPPLGIDRFMPNPGTPADAVRESYMVVPAVTKLTGSFMPAGRPQKRDSVS